MGNGIMAVFPNRADDSLQAAITKQRCVAEYNEHRFIISSATHQGLLDPNEYKIRYLDRVCVKGKEEVIRLFEVFDGDPPELQMLKVETQENLARAQELYYEKRFVDAQVELFKVLARNPTDKVAWHFLVQAAQCLKDGVPETWTGDTVMITK
jgi:two-component system sensor histidine kinase ChiS